MDSNKNFVSATVHEQVTMENTEMCPMDISRVLILYTGGTIGMKMTENHVYKPVPNYFPELLSTMRQFHDKSNNSFDEEMSVNVEVKPEELDSIDENDIFIINGIKTKKKVLKTLVTPMSLYGKRTVYTILEYEELIDSANLVVKDWIRIATDIEINYELFDSFIILHGTDTMAYSASALSFMLENLGKTVILTGSQVPLSEVRNDAIDNLLGTLTIASHYIIPEVTLFFNQKLYRGNRTKKVDATNFNAFDSPNMRPLIKMGININVSWKDVLRSTEIAKFHVHKKLNQNVALLRLFPGISCSTIKSFLTPSIEGVVLETYGAGNAPDKRLDMLEAFKEATDRGVIIVNCTQCNKGLVSDIYATGKVLSDVGLISGKDMTTECALAKLSYLLGKNISKNTCKLLIGKNLRGELTDIPKKPRFSKIQKPQYSYTSEILRILLNDNEPATNYDTTSTNESAATANHGAVNGYDGAVKVPNILIDNETMTPTLNEFRAKDISIQQLSENFEENFVMYSNQLNKVFKILAPMLFFFSISNGDINGLDDLLTKWPNLIRSADYNKQTGLHIASINNHLKTSEYLIKKGCSVHTRDVFNHTPLWYAITSRYYGTRKNKGLIELLINTGAIFASDEMDSVNELLFKSAIHGNIHIIKNLIKGKIDINATDPEERSILHLAIIFKQFRVIDFLLSLDEQESNSKRKDDSFQSLLVANFSQDFEMDNISYSSSIDEISPKTEDNSISNMIKELNNCDSNDSINIDDYSLKYNLADRWGNTPINYITMELNSINNKLTNSEISDKKRNSLLDEKYEYERILDIIKDKIEN